jgi:hypothetical protein
MRFLRAAATTVALVIIAGGFSTGAAMSAAAAPSGAFGVVPTVRSFSADPVIPPILDPAPETPEESAPPVTPAPSDPPIDPVEPVEPAPTAPEPEPAPAPVVAPPTTPTRQPVAPPTDTTIPTAIPTATPTPTPTPTEEAVILPTPTPTPRSENAFIAPIFEGDDSERKNLLATAALAVSGLLAIAVTALVVLRNKDATTAMRRRGVPVNDTRIPVEEAVHVIDERDPFTASTLLLGRTAEPLAGTAAHSQAIPASEADGASTTRLLTSGSRYDTPLDVETIVMKRPEPQRPVTGLLNLQ